MKATLLLSLAAWAAGWTAAGQVTNAGTAETNQVRLEWTAWTGNPYRVFSTPDLVESAWSNLTPEGLTFTNQKGSCTLPMGEARRFYFAIASDYLIVDLAEGPLAPQYPVSYANDPPAGGWGDEYKTTKLVLRRVPGGTFSMGSPTNELGRDVNEPPHAVALTKDYYVGVFEVTQKQWERVQGNWPSRFNNPTYRESRPVEAVSYHEIRENPANWAISPNWPQSNGVHADSFMGKLRAKTGQAFDLPTEAQWEHACRAGTVTALNSGNNLTGVSADAGMAEVGRYWYNGGSDYTQSGDTSVATAKVGSYLPNAWGLYDMHGNAWEWCLDWYENAPAVARDPAGPASGSNRLLRGGGWGDAAGLCRSAGRLNITPDGRFSSLGFRVVLPSDRP